MCMHWYWILLLFIDVSLDNSLKRKEVTLQWSMLKHDQGKEEHAHIHVSLEKDTDVHYILYLKN